MFGGHNLIAENGKILSRSARFKNETIYADLDIARIVGERRRMTTFFSRTDAVYTEIGFHLNKEETKLSRFIDPAPFVPDDSQDRQKRCEEIFAIQYMGLKKRAGAHLLQDGCGGNLRGTGFHSGASGGGQGF